MKGLLYKEFYMGRKSYALFFALAFVFSLLGFLVFLSMICGNMKNMPSEDPQSVKIYATMFIYVPFLLILGAIDGCNQSIYSDYASNWMTYSYTLPTKATKAIGARYLSGVLLLPVCILYGIVNAAVICGISGYPMSVDILKNMVVFMLFEVIYFAIGVPMALKYKTSQAVSTRWGVIFIGCYFVMGLIGVNNGLLDEEVDGNLYMQQLFDKYEAIRDVLLPFIPLMILAVLGISFLISVKMYQRREN